MIDILRLNSKFKKLVLVIIDMVLVGSALYIALLLRFEASIPPEFFANFERILWPAVLIHLMIFYLTGIYRRLWRYASVDEIMLVVFAVSAAAAATYVYSTVLEAMLPRSVYVIYWFLLLFAVGGSRFFIRLLARYLRSHNSKKLDKPALIIGAGDAGVLVAKELEKSPGFRPVGFIDDDPAKQKQVVQGVPVLGSTDDLRDIVSSHKVEEVIIAMPSVPYRNVSRIVKLCSNLPVEMKTVPGIYEFIEGSLNLGQLKEVEVEDLLKREPVNVNTEEIFNYVSGKRVLITGAGGSIGSEMCRQVASLKPDSLMLLDYDENGIFFIYKELEEKHKGQTFYPLVRNVAEGETMQKVFAQYRPQVVFHAAAHKHVPLMEVNLEEAVRNNMFASCELMDLAESYGAERFVLISTDKAVNPGNVMGATKRAAEIYMQYKEEQGSSCVYCAVRFGNVLGSRGSVIPVFKEQIAAGGPVKVTHTDMTRYFMTIPEAVLLVIQAGALGRGGEIFVLDMGDPVRIVDLARDMIYLSGLEPEEDIEIEFTGVRPGEKISEELFNEWEKLSSSRHERIFIAPNIVEHNSEALKGELSRLQEILGVDLNYMLEAKNEGKKIQGKS